MKTINVSEATNLQLDWLVAKCEGAIGIRFDGEFWRVHFGGSEEYLGNLDYTTDWSQMGPIIEREGIGLESEARDHSIWKARFRFTKHIWFRNPTRQIRTYCSMQGSTSLIAAARCYVVSKMGETVEVPEELT